jgi:hypothetical protein
MKTHNKLILLIIILCLININTKTHKSHSKIRHTPKAIDLSNHFGAPQIGSPYGPSTSYDDYVERNPDVFTPQRFTGNKNIEKALEFKPYPGWENKLNPHQVKSGDFTNVAPSASRVINPEITGPKLHLQAEISYPSHVKTPTFYGFKKEMVPVAAYDKVERRIIHDKVVINKPQYGWEDKVSNIKRGVEKFVNLKTGENIEMDNKLVAHGINTEETFEKKTNHGEKKKRRLRRF